MNPKEWGIAAYLNKLKEQSQCLDKQVACVIVNLKGQIVAQGVNEILVCDKNCHDKENRTCEVRHAEVVAAHNFANYADYDVFTAYVNLFPCVPCQKCLASYNIDEIVVFGPQHKDQWFPKIRLEPDIFQELIDHNGEAKQLSVAQGELAEAITAISDYFYRKDKQLRPHALIDEIIDAELMLDQVKKILWTKEPETYNILNAMRIAKFGKLMRSMDRDEI